MTYNPNIPQPIDDMSVSQGDLLTNFGDLNTVYGSSGDHVALDAASNRGKHKKVTFVSQGSDPDTDSPATLENELAMFALEEGSDTELYLRKESNGTVNQITKNNELFIQVYPVFAINMDKNLVVSSSYNYDSGTGVTRLDSGTKAHFKFPFTNAVTDAAGNPTNNYMFVASGFDNSSNPVVGQVPNSSSYGSQVDSTFINIVFKNQNNSTISGLTRCSVVCWKVQ